MPAALSVPSAPVPVALPVGVSPLVGTVPVISGISPVLAALALPPPAVAAARDHKPRPETQTVAS